MKVDKTEQFVNRTSEILGINASEVSKLFMRRPKSSVRLNIHGIHEPETMLRELSVISELTPISWCDKAFVIDSGREALVSSEYFKSGAVSLQNASSLIPPLALNPRQKDKVIDTCASPGIKSGHMADLVSGNFDLTVNEPDPGRQKKLKDFLDLSGVKYCLLSVPAQFLDRRVTETYDKILVDAPCSGEGLIDFSSREPLKYWSLKKIHALSKLQKRILLSALNILKPGGTLVYSTCTLAPEENEGVIDHVLSKRQDIHVERIEISDEVKGRILFNWGDKKFNSEIRKCLRIKPTDYTESFFVCKLKKN